MWKRLLETATSKSAQAALEDIEPVELSGDVLTVQAVGGGHVPSMVLDRLAERLGQLSGRALRVHDQRASSASKVESDEHGVELDDPNVKLVTELFDAEVVNVRRIEGTKED